MGEFFGTQTQFFVRGGTAFWQTTFYDQFGVVTQPGSAVINVVYPNPQTGNDSSTTVNMIAPTGPSVIWTAELDTREFGIGTVSWSIHSQPGPPFAVEDGQFTLTANPANLLTF
jgi:hypothetical protein